MELESVGRKEMIREIGGWQMKYGCCTTMENYGILEMLGYNYIELAGNQIAAMTEEQLKKIKGTIEQGKVKCCGFNAAIPPSVVIAGDGYDAQKAREYAKMLCKRGDFLGIQAIGIGSPKSRKWIEGNIQEAWKQAEEFVSIFAEEAIPYGITILWESLNKTECSFGLKLQEGAALINKIGKKNVKIVFDIYHFFMEQETIEELKAVLPLIQHVHIAERVGTERRYPSEALFSYYKNCLKPLIEIGYSGVISTEAFDGEVKEGAERNKKLLEKIIRELEQEGAK